MIKSIEEILEEGNGYFADDNNEAAFRCYLHAAELGDAEGAKMVGRFYYMDDVVEPDFECAKKWLEIAIERGSLNAYYHMACIYDNDDLFAEFVDMAKAHEYLFEGAKKGDTECQFMLYAGYSDGELDITHEEAMAWLEKSAVDEDVHEFIVKTIDDLGLGSIENEDGTRSHDENDNAIIADLAKVLIAIGDVDGYDFLGDVYEEGGYGVEQDFDLAIETYKKGYELKDGQCALDLYFIYSDDDYPCYDISKARGYLLDAVEYDCAFAKGVLGSNHVAGINGFEVDHEKAERYLLEALEEEENSVFYWRLGEVYIHKDPNDSEMVAKGIEYLEKAVEQGDCFAMYDLFECYMDGTGVDEDFDKALDYLRKAAENDNTKAKYVLGAYMTRGDVEGVKKDYAKAEEYLLTAISRGYEGAYEYLAIIYENGGDGVGQDAAKATECRLKAKKYYDEIN